MEQKQIAPHLQSWLKEEEIQPYLTRTRPGPLLVAGETLSERVRESWSRIDLKNAGMR
jgi:hypothetical protein